VSTGSEVKQATESGSSDSDGKTDKQATESGSAHLVGKAGKQDSDQESTLLDRVITDSLKILAVAGTFVYGALFIGYRAYYSAIGIRAEDVGVNHAFILSRSIGFIFLAAIVAGAIGIFAYAIGRREGFSKKKDLPWVLVAVALVSGHLYFLLKSTKSPLWLDGLSLGVIIVAGVVLGLKAEAGAETGKRKPAWYIGVGLAILLTVLLPAIAIGMRAHELGETAMSGDSVVPIKVLEVPVLDVSTEHVYAKWICPAGEAPPIFRPPNRKLVEGSLLGETSTNIFIRVDQSEPNIIIKLPQECIMVIRSEDYSEADAL
jgi:hypothetical protein